jgi:hypothetical protein
LEVTPAVTKNIKNKRKPTAAGLGEVTILTVWLGSTITVRESDDEVQTE